MERPAPPRLRRVKVVAIDEFGGPDRLKLMDLPEPEVGPDEVLIRVHAAGVGPWDTKTRAGVWGTEAPLPLVLGTESAGVVEQLGSDVTDFAVGDEVYAYAMQKGNYAELVAAPAAATAAKPRSLSFEEAAGLPVTGTAAHQVITEDLAVRSGETVLITGAAGGVGSLAVQLAARAGAHVIATAGEEDHEFVRSLGAEEAYAYLDTDFVAAIREAHPDGVDALFDCVSGENLAQSLDAVRDGGRAVGLVPPPPESPPRGITASFAFGRPDGARLREVARLIDEGELKVFVQETLPLAEAARAHELIESGHVRGKIVLRVA